MFCRTIFLLGALLVNICLARTPYGKSINAPVSKKSKYLSVTQISNDAVDWTYYIGPRDILEITVMELEQFERKGLGDELLFPVNANGQVNVPLVGLVKAEGKTPSQLMAELSTLFRKYVTHPQVSVVVHEYRSKLVHVLGKVYQNGSIPLRHEKTTLFEILAEAGGFSSKLPTLEGVALNQPDMRHVYVIRKNQKFVVNVYDRLIDRDSDEAFYLEPGDKVFVPEPVETISVLGGVKKAGNFELKSEMTLLRAIALAGSFLEESSRRDQVKIIRRGLKRPMNVNAVRIWQGKDPDIKLKPGDIVYVAEW